MLVVRLQLTFLKMEPSRAHGGRRRHGRHDSTHVILERLAKSNEQVTKEGLLRRLIGDDPTKRSRTNERAVDEATPTATTHAPKRQKPPTAAISVAEFEQSALCAR